MNNRRNFLTGAGAITAAVSAAAVSRVAMAALPEPVMQTKPDTMAPLVPNTGRPYNPVVTLNGWTLPWRMNNGVGNQRGHGVGLGLHHWLGQGSHSDPANSGGADSRCDNACTG